MTTLLQASLTGGELPPSLYGMVDLAWYKNCLATCRNFEVYPYGGIRNRSGSRMVTEVKNSAKRVRLIPFSFNQQQTYVLEVGEGYTRIISNGAPLLIEPTATAWAAYTKYSAGAVVVESGSLYRRLVDGVSAATFVADFFYWEPVSTTTVVEVVNYYAEADLRSINYTQSADVLTLVHNNYKPRNFNRASATSFTFTDATPSTGPFQEMNVDKTITVRASANEGVVTLSASADLFYAKHVGMLFKLEQKDFGISWLPGVVTNREDIRRSGGNYYVALTSGTTGQNIPIGTDDHWNDGGVDWGYLHNGFGVARIIEITDAKTAKADVILRLPDGSISAGFAPSIPATASIAHASGWIEATASTIALPLGSYGTCLATLSNDYGSSAVELSVGYRVLSVGGTTSQVLFEYPRTSTIIETGGGEGASTIVPVVYTVDSFKPHLSSGATASHKWAFGAFGSPTVGDATNGYGPGFPAAVTYYQQRLCYAGTLDQPDSIWTSKTGAFADFGQSMPVLDDDSVVYTLASNQVNAIRSLLQLEKLLLLTDGSVWATGTGQQTDVLTPGNIGVKLQGYQGVANLPPLGIGNSALYVQEKGQVVRDINYQWANDAYTGQNLTARGSHLIDGHTIVEWAFQQSPLSTVWMVREDGVLLGLTYLREQEVAAWHRHDTDGEYESVCVVSEGAEDVLYVVVKRVINGVTKRFIERFDTRVVTDIRDAFFVDCGLSFDGRNTTSTTIALSGGTDYDDSEVITLTASSATFQYPATTDVGDHIVYEDPSDGALYRVEILDTASATVAHGRPMGTVPVAFRSATTAWGWARNTLAGLGHLEGKEVAILADGVEQPRATVVSGTVTLQTPAVRAHVGLPYDCDAETLPLAPQTPGQTIRAANKLVSVLRAVVNECSSLWAGPDADSLLQTENRVLNSGREVPVNLVTGIVEIRLNSTWERNGQTLIRHSSPTPVNILALMPEVDVGGA